MAPQVVLEPLQPPKTGGSGRGPPPAPEVSPQAPAGMPPKDMPRRRQKLRHHSEAPPREQDRPFHVVPIWLGSGTREEVVPVRSIKQIVPEDMHQNETVIAIDDTEGDAAFCAAQARFVEAAESLEQAISLRRKFLGDNHPDFLASIESYVVCCNVWGMQSLGSGRCTVALEMLKKAEAMTEADNVPNFKRRVALRAATFNNLCCYFRDRGKSNAALQFAEKALKIEQRYKEAESPARTYLNYAVLLSTMGRNEEALEHIESAIAVLHDEERQLTYEQVNEQDELKRQETCSILVVAHYNMWVENLRLNRHVAGLDCLQRAANIAVHKLSPSHPMAEKMQQNYAEAKERFGLKVPGTPRTPRVLPKMAVTTSEGFRSTIEADHFHFNARDAHPWHKVRLEEANAEMAQEILCQNRQITLRTSRPEPKPPPPSEKMPPRTRSRRQMRLHKQTYGTDHVGKELSGAWWDTHPKLQTTKGFAGSPILQQQAHGVQPMVSMRSPRTSSAARKQASDVGTGADPKLLTGTSMASTAQEAAAMSTASSWPPVPSSPGGRAEPAATLASSGPESPHMVAAYEYHRRRMQMRENGTEDVEGDELALEPGRLEAISVLRNRLDTRRAKGLPTPTDLNKNQAATKIQAMTRGHQVRRWSIEELAREMRRQRSLDGAEARGMSAPVGASDGKRRVAFKVIHAARQAYAEYSAASKIQKVARGCITRANLRKQIEQIANLSAAKVQASLRCWVARNQLKRRKQAVIRMQAWARQVLACQRVAGIRRLAVLLTRVARGGFTRCHLQEKHQMATRIQRWIRGGKTRVRLQHRLACALQIQRFVRGCACRRLQLRRNTAASRIAALFRGCMTRLRLQKRRAAAVYIQSWWRARKDLKWYRRVQASSSLIQGFTRGRKVRGSMLFHASASIRLQSSIRRYLQVRRQRKWMRAVVDIQRLVRGVQTRSKLSRKNAAATRIQAFRKGMLSRRRGEERNHAAVKIQAAVRGIQSNMRLQSQRKAARRIQALARGVKARSSHARLLAATIRIAAFYRGRLGRRYAAQIKAEKTSKKAAAAATAAEEAAKAKAAEEAAAAKAAKQAAALKEAEEAAAAKAAEEAAAAKAAEEAAAAKAAEEAAAAKAAEEAAAAAKAAKQAAALKEAEAAAAAKAAEEAATAKAIEEAETVKAAQEAAAKAAEEAAAAAAVKTAEELAAANAAEKRAARQAEEARHAAEEAAREEAREAEKENARLAAEETAGMAGRQAEEDYFKKAGEGITKAKTVEADDLNTTAGKDDEFDAAALGALRLTSTSTISNVSLSRPMTADDGSAAGDAVQEVGKSMVDSIVRLPSSPSPPPGQPSPSKPETAEATSKTATAISNTVGSDEIGTPTPALAPTSLKTVNGYIASEGIGEPATIGESGKTAQAVSFPPPPEEFADLLPLTAETLAPLASETRNHEAPEAKGSSMADQGDDDLASYDVKVLIAPSTPSLSQVSLSRPATALSFDAADARRTPSPAPDSVEFGGHHAKASAGPSTPAAASIPETTEDSVRDASGGPSRGNDGLVEASMATKMDDMVDGDTKISSRPSLPEEFTNLQPVTGESLERVGSEKSGPDTQKSREDTQEAKSLAMADQASGNDVSSAAEVTKPASSSMPADPKVPINSSLAAEDVGPTTQLENKHARVSPADVGSDVLDDEDTIPLKLVPSLSQTSLAPSRPITATSVSRYGNVSPRSVSPSSLGRPLTQMSFSRPMTPDDASTAGEALVANIGELALGDISEAVAMASSSVEADDLVHLQASSPKSAAMEESVSQVLPDDWVHPQASSPKSAAMEESVSQVLPDALVHFEVSSPKSAAMEESVSPVLPNDLVHLQASSPKSAAMEESVSQVLPDDLVHFEVSSPKSAAMEESVSQRLPDDLEHFEASSPKSAAMEESVSQSLPDDLVHLQASSPKSAAMEESVSQSLPDDLVHFEVSSPKSAAMGESVSQSLPDDLVHFEVSSPKPAAMEGLVAQTLQDDSAVLESSSPKSAAMEESVSQTLPDDLVGISITSPTADEDLEVLSAADGAVAGIMGMTLSIRTTPDADVENHDVYSEDGEVNDNGESRAVHDDASLFSPDFSQLASTGGREVLHEPEEDALIQASSQDPACHPLL